MRDLNRLLGSFATAKRGATAIEYGLILSLIFLAMLVGIRNFANSASNMYTYVADTTRDASNPSTP